MKLMTTSLNKHQKYRSFNSVNNLPSASQENSHAVISKFEQRIDFLNLGGHRRPRRENKNIQMNS